MIFVNKIITMQIHWNWVVLITLVLCSVCGQAQQTGWKNKQADIFFMVDGSSSIWIVDFKKLLDFVNSLVTYMDIGPSFTRVGVGVYSEYHTVHIFINNTLSKEALKYEITRVPYVKGNAYLSRALKGIREQGLPRNMVRSNVPQMAVLFTDGASRHKQLTADNATLVKKDGIFLFSVGIGSGVDKDEMRLIASDPKDDFSYHVPDFDHLSDIRAQLSSKMSEVDLFQGDEGTCGDKTKVDAVFVFDESSVGDKDTVKIKNFIQAVVEGVAMNSGNVRVGVVSKTCHEGDISLGQYVTKEDFIAGLHYKRGPDIIDLFKRVRQYSFLLENGARADADIRRRIVLILNNIVEKKTEILREATRAKYAGIEIFVIRLGADYDKTFITSLASNFENTEYFDSAEEMSKKDSVQKFTKSFCRDI